MKTKLLILCLVVASSVQSQNLLQNPSFEQFSGNIPNSWTITNGSSQKETTTIKEGLASLNGLPESLSPFFAPAFRISQDFTLSDIEIYTLKFDYYIPGSVFTNNIDQIGFELRLNNPADAFFFPSPANLTPAFGEWKTVELDFKILAFRGSATSTVIKLTLAAGSSPGFTGTNAFFDNVIVAKKSTLTTTDFEKQDNPILYISREEIKLNSGYKDSSYVIYSLDGKAIKRGKNVSSDGIGISELSRGVYLLKLNDLSTSVKFIKE